MKQIPEDWWVLTTMAITLLFVMGIVYLWTEDVFPKPSKYKHHGKRKQKRH